MEASEKPKTYSPEEVEAKLKEHGLDNWYLEGDWIRRKYNTDGWPSTLMAVNAIGYVCEAAYHHADLAVTWGKLWVKLMNHAAGVDYVLSLNGDNRHIAERLRATPVLIPDTPDDLDSLDATIAHMSARRGNELLQRKVIAVEALELRVVRFAVQPNQRQKLRVAHRIAELVAGREMRLAH